MKLKFIDLKTYSVNSVGVDSPTRLIEEAKLLKIDIGLCDGVRYPYLSGIFVDAKNKKELLKKIKKARALYDYILFRGGEKNRLGVSVKGIDILTDAGAVDPYVARMASKNEIAVEICIGDLIHTSKSSRIRALKCIHHNIKFSRKYGFDLIVTSGARNRYELKNVKSTSEILKFLGMENEEIKHAMLDVPRKIIERKKEEVRILG